MLPPADYIFRYCFCSPRLWCRRDKSRLYQTFFKPEKRSCTAARAFPNPGNGVARLHGLSPIRGMVLHGCMGFPQVGEWCCTAAWAFPKLGNDVAWLHGLSPSWEWCCTHTTNKPSDRPASKQPTILFSLQNRIKKKIEHIFRIIRLKYLYLKFIFYGNNQWRVINF